MQILNAENRDWKELFLANKIPIIASTLLVATGVTAAAVSTSIADSDQIISGVNFEGQPLAGMNDTAAQNFFQNVAEKRMQPLTFQYGEETFTVTPAEIGWTPQINDAVTKAQSYGRGGSFFENLGSQINSMSQKPKVELTANFNENLLNQKIAEIASKIDTQPVNAVVNLNGNDIEKIPGVIGKKLNQEKLAESLKDPLTNLTASNGVIPLEPEEIQPFITTEDIAQIDTVLGEYTTYYYPGNRGYNIWLAATSISDKIVKTGWVFSFNDTVGLRTYAAGYSNAPVIINGKTEDGVGGGVCQVSSTLYNAVLLAGLTPTERTPHFFKSGYIGAGRDATVADEQIDFKFRNDLPHPVYTKAFANGYDLTVCILGTRADLNGATVAIETGGSDMNPSVYRVFYKDGEVVKDEFLHTDRYYNPKDFEN